MSEIPQYSFQKKGAESHSFDTTHWTVVLAAGRESEKSRERALAQLCERYWYPLYSFVRRQGSNHQDAQDLTQGFFLHLLRHDAVGDARPERGRFRTFLLHSLKHFLISEHRKVSAEKRGGSLAFESLDDKDWDQRFRHEPSHDENPERLYHRNWADALIEHALVKLEREQKRLGNGPRFALLKDYVAAPGEVPDGEFVANSLGLSRGALAQALFRIRERFRQILREQVMVTVTNEAEVDDELRSLLSSL